MVVPEVSSVTLQFSFQGGQPPETRLQRESENLEILQFMSDFPKSNLGSELQKRNCDIY